MADFDPSRLPVLPMKAGDDLPFRGEAVYIPEALAEYLCPVELRFFILLMRFVERYGDFRVTYRQMGGVIGTVNNTPQHNVANIACRLRDMGLVTITRNKGGVGVKGSRTSKLPNWDGVNYIQAIGKLLQPGGMKCLRTMMGNRSVFGITLRDIEKVPERYRRPLPDIYYGRRKEENKHDNGNTAKD